MKSRIRTLNVGEAVPVREADPRKAAYVGGSSFPSICTPHLEDAGSGVILTWCRYRDHACFSLHTGGEQR
jgi:hypothetical protein